MRQNSNVELWTGIKPHRIEVVGKNHKKPSFNRVYKMTDNDEKQIINYKNAFKFSIEIIKMDKW